MAKKSADIEITRRWDFLEQVRRGTGDLNAAVAIGWSPAEMRKALSDPEFRDLVEMAREQILEDLEEVVLGVAMNGTRWAAEMWLYSKGKHRGWTPPTHKVDVHSRTEVEHRVVITAVDAIKQLMAEQTDPEAMQRFSGAIEAQAS